MLALLDVLGNHWIYVHEKCHDRRALLGDASCFAGTELGQHPWMLLSVPLWQDAHLRAVFYELAT